MVSLVNFVLVLTSNKRWDGYKYKPFHLGTTQLFRFLSQILSIECRPKKEKRNVTLPCIEFYIQPSLSKITFPDKPGVSQAGNMLRISFCHCCSFNHHISALIMKLPVVNSGGKSLKNFSSLEYSERIVYWSENTDTIYIMYNVFVVFRTCCWMLKVICLPVFSPGL